MVMGSAVFPEIRDFCFLLCIFLAIWVLVDGDAVVFREFPSILGGQGRKSG